MGQQANLQFATKVWTHGRRQGEAQIEQSFELMKADHIDVFQIHNLLDWQTHLETLERLKDEGRTSVIGITHYTTSAFPEMMRIMRSRRIDSVQVPYNVGDLACTEEMLPLAEELGIGVIVMEPSGSIPSPTAKTAERRAVKGGRTQQVGAGGVSVGGVGPAGECRDSCDITPGANYRKRTGW